MSDRYLEYLEFITDSNDEAITAAINDGATVELAAISGACSITTRCPDIIPNYLGQALTHRETPIQVHVIKSPGKPRNYGTLHHGVKFTQTDPLNLWVPTEDLTEKPRITVYVTGETTPEVRAELTATVAHELNHLLVTRVIMAMIKLHTNELAAAIEEQDITAMAHAARHTRELISTLSGTVAQPGLYESEFMDDILYCNEFLEQAAMTAGIISLAVLLQMSNKDGGKPDHELTEAATKLLVERISPAVKRGYYCALQLLWVVAYEGGPIMDSPTCGTALLTALWILKLTDTKLDFDVTDVKAMTTAIAAAQKSNNPVGVVTHGLN